MNFNHKGKKNTRDKKSHGNMHIRDIIQYQRSFFPITANKPRLNVKISMDTGQNLKLFARLSTSQEKQAVKTVITRYFLENSVEGAHKNSEEIKDHTSHYMPLLKEKDNWAVVENIFTEYRLSYPIRKELFDLFMDTASEILSRNTDLNHSKNLLTSRLNRIRQLFKLRDNEALLFNYLYTVKLNDLYEFDRRFAYPRDYLLEIMASTALTRALIMSAIKESGTLFKSGILRRIDSMFDCEIDATIDEYLNGLIDEDELMHSFIQFKDDPILPLEKFEIDPGHTRIMQSLLKKKGSAHILLYGVPGSGKTEYARSLVKSIGKRAIFVSQDEGEDRGRLPALYAAFNMAGRDDIIIMDEADFLLNNENYFDDSVEKARIHAILERKNARMIWIVNEKSRSYESILRRFDYSLEFKKLGFKQRLLVWNNILEESPLKKYLDPVQTELLARKVELNAGSISKAVSNTEKILGKRKLSDSLVFDTLNTFLAGSYILIHRRELDDLNKVGKELYSLDTLNTSIPLDEVLEAVRLRKKDERLSLLLQGIPGTGKTQFARHLSNRFDIPLKQVKYSEIASKYIGETEQNLARIFRQAQDEQAILLLDEIDSLFQSREAATRSWEITQVNELLTQIEEFEGILICTTNRISALDRAALRRFDYKIEFKAIEPARLFPFIRFFFAGILVQDDSSLPCSIEGVTFGDLEVIRRNLQRTRRQYTLTEIMARVRDEISYRDVKPPMGF